MPTPLVVLGVVEYQKFFTQRLRFLTAWKSKSATALFI